MKEDMLFYPDLADIAEAALNELVDSAFFDSSHDCGGASGDEKAPAKGAFSFD